jgi:glutamate-1-semialdehyde 2,1-aminomutase
MARTREDPIAGPKSRRAFAAASRVIPGGVNSPVRAWKRLGGNPPVIARGKGAVITDLDGRRYVDYVLSWGPLLHGHAHPRVLRAVADAAKRGLGFGAPTQGETELAELLCSALPSVQQVRLVSSGTEACMSALRLARAATGRELAIKFDGCYHGHADQVLVAAGSGCATLNTPDSAGVPASVSGLTVSCPYNDAAAVERMLVKHRGQVAAVIVEPVAGNMGLVLPRPGFLEGLRQLCSAHGALLIFDEVMTGFRVGWGGWQVVSGIRPDLTCLGKVIGGGLPAAAYGGARDLMAHLAPLGACYQAGTLSGNPVAVAAGLATLKLASRPGFYPRTAAGLTRMIDGLRAIAARHGVAVQFGQAGTMWGYYFSDKPVTDWTSAQTQDDARWRRFITAMYRAGIYLAPSPYEAAFWSSAHTQRDVQQTLMAAEVAFAEAS